jgi:hypothetical protein
LGWKPYTSVATSLDLRRSFQEINGWTGQDPNRYDRWRAELRAAGAKNEQDAKKAWQTDLSTAREMLKELGWEPGMAFSEILA